MSDELHQSREEVNRIDREFVRLLARRMDAVRRIGELKRVHRDTPLRDFERERQLLEVWSQEAEAQGLSDYFAGRVLREILNYSRRDQERILGERREATRNAAVRVGFQGTPGSYSDLAIKRLFATRQTGKVERQGFPTFRPVVDALENGDVDYALLPVENTIAGTINEVYQLLGERAVTVVDEEIWPVEHCLAGIPGSTVHGIRTVRSQPVALQQCQRFLDTLAGCKGESYYDTAAAARSVSEAKDASIGAICSEDAAHRYGLAVLQREVADQKRNLTRFLLISLKPEPVDPRQPTRTSLVWTVNHRRGALASCLQAFSAEDINLSKLESRPLPDSPWQYMFYVDVEGHVEDPRVSRALDLVREHTNHLKVLGSYPRRTGEEAPVPTRAPAAAPAAEPATRRTTHVGEEDARLPLCGLKGGGERTVLQVGGIEVGGAGVALAAGPAVVEGRSQIMEAAALAKRAGATFLRAGVFSSAGSPDGFPGLGLPGLEMLAEAGRAYEVPVMTEVLRTEDAARVAELADLLEVAGRDMQNFTLLKELGTLNRPVLLRRGASATIDELLLAAEFLMASGNHRVVLCESGIRTFETATRSTLDVSAIPALRQRTHLPIFVDPTQSGRTPSMATDLALAALAARADGVLLRAHPTPATSQDGGATELDPDALTSLRQAAAAIVSARGRTFPGS